MRKAVLYLLSLFVVLFYAGVAGAAVSPYYGAVTDFIHNATAKIAVPKISVLSSAGGPTAPAGSAAGGSAVNGIQVGAATATARASATPIPSPTMTAQQKATLRVLHLSAHARPLGHRINILVLGSDNDAKFLVGATPPTQVMIVASIDPVSKTLTLFSIPRDSWVRIPGYPYNTGPDGTPGWNKIDIASGYGFRSSACTVETDFGIHIDNWVWVGLQGFIKVIDTVGGVTIDVPHPVLDDAYPDDLTNSADPNAAYGYRRLYIPPGPQHLNGSTALLFVRSRHGDLASDFGRSSRQQIVIQQLRRALLSNDAASLVALVPSLLAAMRNDLRTDIPVDLSTAANYWSVLRAAAHYKVTSVVLSPPYTSSYYPLDHDPAVEKFSNGQPFQQDALQVNWDLVNPLVQSIFGPQDYSASSAQYCSGV